MKNNPSGSDKILWILKTRGAQPLTALAEEMKITTEGVRFQLTKLAGEGLVTSVTESKGRGRPQQIWSLTASGQARFPDTHAEITVKLIQTIRETLGQEALDTVIRANGQNLLERYTRELAEVQGLEKRIARLAEIRDREGYMATYEKDTEGFLLVENHCPICAAATECQNFCHSELATFRTVLGERAEVRRVDHLLSGARRCTYRIVEK